MEIHFEDSGTPRACDFADGSLPPEAAPSPHPVEKKTLFERERVRAGKAEARCEDLRWREVEARSRANSLQAILDRNWAKLNAALAEIREVRHKAKQALALDREVTRLNRLLAATGVDTRKRSTVVSLRMENGTLKAEVRALQDRVAALEARNEALHSSRSSMSRSTCGRKSGKKSRPSSARKRGQPSGAPGHGRTKRPKLEVKAEWHDLPEDARTNASGSSLGLP